jgi:outer membrane protein assembly factor BamB
MRRSFSARIVSLGALGLTLAVLVADSPALVARAGGNWPQWRGPRRDGVSTEVNLLQTWPAGGPPKLWVSSGLGEGFSSVSISGGRIFTMGDRGDGQYVFGLNETNGQQIWATRVGSRHQDEYGGPRGTPTVDGALLYAVDTDGDIVCLETATGKERWRRNMPRDFGGQMMSSWMFSESPLVDGDRVIVTPGGRGAAIVALDKLTGKDVWRATLPSLGSGGRDGAGYSSIMISNGGGVKHYVQLMGRGLVGVRADDGTFLWGYNRVANSTANISTPIIKDDLVFDSTGYGQGAALVQLSADGAGKVKATERYFLDGNTLQNHHGGFVLIDGVLYAGHGQSNGFPVAVDMATGKMLWSRMRGAGTGSAAVTAADGRLYYRYQDGTMALIAANPAEYQLIGSFRIPNATPNHPSWSHPVISDGKLYLREQDFLNVYSIKR